MPLSALLKHMKLLILPFYSDFSCIASTRPPVFTKTVTYWFLASPVRSFSFFSQGTHVWSEFCKLTQVCSRWVFCWKGKPPNARRRLQTQPGLHQINSHHVAFISWGACRVLVASITCNDRKRTRVGINNDIWGRRGQTRGKFSLLSQDCETLINLPKCDLTP